MSLVDLDREPSVRDLRVFSGLLVAFSALLAAVVTWRPDGALRAAAVLGAAWIVSLIFNREDRRRQLLGILLPALLAAPAWAALASGSPRTVGAAVLVAGAGLAGACAASQGLARGTHRTWLAAAVPIGWSISAFALLLVYHLVLTPVGWVARALGHDPLRLRRPRADSYWVERSGAEDPSRYFRQF